MSYSCVFFDLDGTLVDTIEDIAAAMNHAMAKHGFPPLRPEDYVPIVGNGVRRLAFDALPEDLRSESLASVLALDSAAYYVEHPVVFAKPYPGIQKLLAELKQKKIKTAVLSNKLDIATQLVIDALFPAGTFNAVAGERKDRPRKPDPGPAWEMLSSIDRTPRQTIFVGDSEVDIETAINIGCLPVGVSWGYRDVSVIVGAGAARVINKPAELLEVICKN
jgi:phosphoglycolate phosphatase